MEIKLVDELSDSENRHLFHWRERVFPIEGKELTWAQSAWHLLAFDGGEMPIAHLGYGNFSIFIDGLYREQVVGVGGVVARPEVQGKNIPSNLFNHLHESAHALALSKVFTLFCPERLIGYYQKHGYIAFGGELSFLQGGSQTTSENFMFMSYGRPLSAHTIKIESEPW